MNVDHRILDVTIFICQENEKKARFRGIGLFKYFKIRFYLNTCTHPLN